MTGFSKQWGRRIESVGKTSIPLAALALISTPLIAAAPAAAKPPGKVFAKTTNHSSGELDPTYMTTPFMRKPDKGSITIQVLAKPDDPADDERIYVSGGVHCVKNGTGYDIGAVYRHVYSPFVKKAPFPYGVRKPDRCRVTVSSNFDPDPLPPVPEPLPAGTITIKVWWKK